MKGGNNGQIIIKRVNRKHAPGHHGGSWKVAYADFVTAMMAFFLLMWLMGSTTREERAAISEYFTAPSAVEGKSPVKSSHPTAIQGPGGASTSLIELGGSASPEFARDRSNIAEHGAQDVPAIDPDSAEEIARTQELKRLEGLKASLESTIAASRALEPYKDQLLIDITPDGLRIQIIDKENRSMFDLSSVELKGYTIGILQEIGKLINTVPNKISISGHTDARRYTGRPGYSNWELSADRANVARRVLIEGGMDENKVARVVGMGSSDNFNKDDPYAANNRRISILVMNRRSEASGEGEPAGE